MIERSGSDTRVSGGGILTDRIQSVHERKLQGMFWIKWIVLMLLAYLCFTYIIGIAVVKGTSMIPTLVDKEVVIFNRLIKEFQLEDIVIISIDEDTRYIKRIIGLPGDIIDIKEGILYRNGEEIKESYIYENTYQHSSSISYPFSLKKGEIFVLGDHRSVSKDSRIIGAVKESSLDGKIVIGIKLLW